MSVCMEGEFTYLRNNNRNEEKMSPSRSVLNWLVCLSWSAIGRKHIKRISWENRRAEIISRLEKRRFLDDQNGVFYTRFDDQNGVLMTKTASFTGVLMAKTAFFSQNVMEQEKQPDLYKL